LRPANGHSLDVLRMQLILRQLLCILRHMRDRGDAAAATVYLSHHDLGQSLTLPRPPLTLQAATAHLLAKQTRETRLRNTRFYVLDNSIRETTVAAVRGHTLADKRAIMAAVRRCGITDMLVGTFSATRMVDDVFAEEAVAAWGPAHLWAFSELRDRVIGGVPDSGVPLGLAKCARYGLANCVIELDLDDAKTDWAIVSLRHFIALLMLRLAWARVHLSPAGRVLINIRDFPLAWAKVPTRVKVVTAFLARLPPSIRPEGLVFEDPAAESLPRDLAEHVAATRAVMDTHGWSAAGC
jgi:hypothetical protein